MKKLLTFWVYITASFAAYADELPCVRLSSGEGIVVQAASSVCVFDERLCVLYKQEVDAERFVRSRYSLQFLDTQNDLVVFNEDVVIPAGTLVNTGNDVKPDKVRNTDEFKANLVSCALRRRDWSE